MTNAPSRAHAQDASAAQSKGRGTARFDYNAAAELFPTRRRMPRRQPLGYKRFTQAAQAIRFAMEDLPPDRLIGAYLEVDEQRYTGDDIRRLYNSAEYPLKRRSIPSDDRKIA